MLKNSTVILSFKLPGTLISYGRYEYHERTTSGKILDESQRLFISKIPIYSNCYKRVELSSTFVNMAISIKSRPRRDENFKAYVYWNTMSEEDRLHYYICKYINDNNAFEYDYMILYGE
jgi:hypothetical protein